MKKGFTLIELLAVIIILAIIASITSPIITGLIDNARKEAFKDSAYGIIKSGKFLHSNDLLNKTKEEVTFTYTDGVESSSIPGKKLDYNGTKPKSGSVVINSEGQVAIAIHNNTWCVEKDFNDSKVTISTKELSLCRILPPPAVPELTIGMIPVKWDETNWIKANINEKWYDYEEKEWANAVLVTEATRSTYINASAGTIINQADVLAYLVWIPRYRYKLFNTNSAIISPQTIDIMFEKKDIQKSNGDENGEWLTHPAFTFVNEISGFWVGKFETTGDATTPTVRPGVTPLSGQNVSTQFQIARKFNDQTIYGLTNDFDAHMMKNMEWGAVAYLSHSLYGTAVDISSNSSIYTGGSYNINSYVTNIGHSTTGNIYGIYDMSGGADEYVMGGMYNSDGITIMVENSGFDQTTIDSLDMKKYIDKYEYGSNDYQRRKLGDATGETRGWYNEMDSFVSNYGKPWFKRGGTRINYTRAGVFARLSDSGQGYSGHSFRLSILKF